jgi:hypothetical protein
LIEAQQKTDAVALAADKRVDGNGELRAAGRCHGKGIALDLIVQRTFVEMELLCVGLAGAPGFAMAVLLWDSEIWW